MTDTITLTRVQYETLIAEKEALQDQVAALDADDGTRIPHEVALAIIRGERPIVAFRAYHGVTVRDLAARAGIAPGYLSEIERGRKPGSATALSRIAEALGTTIDALVTLR